MSQFAGEVYGCTGRFISSIALDKCSACVRIAAPVPWPVCRLVTAPLLQRGQAEFDPLAGYQVFLDRTPRWRGTGLLNRTAAFKSLAVYHICMRINLKHTPVLVLNASYEAINVISAQRAFTSLAKGIAVMEETSSVTVHSGRDKFLMPSVIRLLQYRRIPRRTRTLSRKGILSRDRYTCQYCLSEDSPSKLTLDHIVPRSRGGANAWENLVACCFSCNNRKGDRTPDEAGMPLRRYPRPFSVHTSRHLLRDSAMDNELWQKYLYYENNVPVV